MISLADFHEALRSAESADDLDALYRRISQTYHRAIGEGRVLMDERDQAKALASRLRRENERQRALISSQANVVRERRKVERLERRVRDLETLNRSLANLRGTV